MTKSATEILSANGISLRSYRHGNQKVRCPRCSDARKNKREPCLSVEVGDDGVRFHCHNCAWSGGEFYDQRREECRAAPPRKKSSARDVARLYR